MRAVRIREGDVTARRRPLAAPVPAPWVPEPAPGPAPFPFPALARPFCSRSRRPRLGGSPLPVRRRLLLRPARREGDGPPRRLRRRRTYAATLTQPAAERRRRRGRHRGRRRFGRTAMLATCTRLTISSGAARRAGLRGIRPAPTSCSAIATAKATASRRPFDPPKKTPSHSVEKGSALTRRCLLRARVVRLDVPLLELIVGRIVAVLVVEPVAVCVLPARHFLLFGALFADLVVVVDDQRNRCRGSRGYRG